MASPLSYQVGGALADDNKLYVERSADQELLNHLMAGDYCFVFNCRQMGKSSLRVRAMKRLKLEGVVCAVMDPQLCSESTTEEEWYAGMIYGLLKDFGLEQVAPFLPWWKECDDSSLSPGRRFLRFVDEILLVQITAPIVIFVEEVDRLCSYNFDTDGFLGLVRSLRERRTTHPAYQRLTFCFLGVATPYDLVRNRHALVFNIGKPIEMSGLALPQARALLAGLEGKVAHPSAVLEAVLAWTGGQPFLTQKLLALVSRQPDRNLSAPQLVEALATQQIISHWESQDEPPHLRAIRDRLLRNDDLQKKRQLLSLVQAIHEKGGIPSDAGSSEQMQLRLTGLVVPREGLLRIYNPIYQQVFNQAWVQEQLKELPPPVYVEAIRAWREAAENDRSSRLISGAALEEAEEWAGGRADLAIDEQTFLEDSRAAFDAALAVSSARQAAEERAIRAERQTKLVAGGGVLLLILIAALSAYFRGNPVLKGWQKIEAYCLAHTTKDISCGEKQVFESDGEPSATRLTGYDDFRNKDYGKAREEFAKHLDDPQARIAMNNADILRARFRGPIYTIAVSSPADKTRPEIHTSILDGVARAQSAFNQTPARKLFVIMANDAYKADVAREVASHLADQDFVLAMIGTYSSEITYHQLLALRGKTMPYVSGTATASKAAFMDRAKEDGAKFADADLRLFLRAISTTPVEAEGLVRHIQALRPRGGRILFFFQDKDLYARSYLADFKAYLSRYHLRADWQPLDDLSGRDAPRRIRSRLHKFRQEQSDGNGATVIGILLEASRPEEQRNNVDLILQENRRGDYVIVGANTLFGNDLLKNQDVMSNPEVRKRLTVNTSYPPGGKEGPGANRISGGVYDAAAIILHSINTLEKAKKPVSRANLAELFGRGAMKVEVPSLERSFSLENSERGDLKKVFTVTPSCVSMSCKWVDWNPPR